MEGSREVGQTHTDRKEEGGQRGGEEGGESPPTPLSRKPTLGSAGVSGSRGEVGFQTLPHSCRCERGRVYPTTKKETAVGGSDRGNTLGYPDNLQEEQRKREGGQRCELAAGGPENCTGKGLLVPQPHGTYTSGAESWDAPCARSSHGSRPCWKTFQPLSQAQGSAQGSEAELAGAGRDAARKHPWWWATVALWMCTKQHPGASMASQTLCSWPVPSTVTASPPAERTALYHPGLPASGRDTSSRPLCSSSSPWRYFTHCFPSLISLHRGTLPQHTRLARREEPRALA